MTPISWMHAFVDVPGEDVAKAHAFWSAVLGWPVGDPWPGHPEFASFVPTDGAPYVHVQRIDGPPRIHLDLVGEIDRDTARLEGLGASPGVPRRGLAGDGLARRAAVLRVPGDVAARAADGGRVAGRPPQQAGAAHRRRACRPVRPGAGVLAGGHRLGRRGRRRPRVPPAGAPAGEPAPAAGPAARGGRRRRSRPAPTWTSARTTSTPRSSASDRSAPACSGRATASSRSATPGPAVLRHRQRPEPLRPCSQPARRMAAASVGTRRAWLRPPLPRPLPPTPSSSSSTR